MRLAEIRALDFRSEAAATRRVLERIPEDKLSWRPHPKSYSAGELATHISNLPNWSMAILRQDEFDMNPPGGVEMPRPELVTSISELLERFDTAVATVAGTLESTEDSALHAPWTFKNGGTVRMTLPRLAAFDAFVVRHWVHHRAQLGVYLRLLDVPVPQVYGPTADEPTM